MVPSPSGGLGRQCDTAQSLAHPLPASNRRREHAHLLHGSRPREDTGWRREFQRPRNDLAERTAGGREFVRTGRLVPHRTVHLRRVHPSPFATTWLPGQRRCLAPDWPHPRGRQLAPPRSNLCSARLPAPHPANEGPHPPHARGRKHGCPCHTVCHRGSQGALPDEHHTIAGSSRSPDTGTRNRLQQSALEWCLDRTSDARCSRDGRRHCCSAEGRVGVECRTRRRAGTLVSFAPSAVGPNRYMTRPLREATFHAREYACSAFGWRHVQSPQDGRERMLQGFLWLIRYPLLRRGRRLFRGRHATCNAAGGASLHQNREVVRKFDSCSSRQPCSS